MRRAFSIHGIKLIEIAVNNSIQFGVEVVNNCVKSRRSPDRMLSRRDRQREGGGSTTVKPIIILQDGESKLRDTLTGFFVLIVRSTDRPLSISTHKCNRVIDVKLC